MNRLRGALPQSLGAAHYVTATVLLVRLVVLARFAGSSALLPTGGDMQFYHSWAERIVAGTWSDGLAFYGLPLYAYWLAFLYSLFGANPFIAVLPQALMEAGTALLLYALALRVFSNGTGISRPGAKVIAIIAASGWALFVPAQAYAVVLMPTTLLTFAFWFVVWQVVRREDVPAHWKSLLIGVMIGFTAMAVATILVLVPLVACALFLRHAKPLARRSFFRAAIAAFALAGGVLLGTSPAWIHNALVAHDPVFLSAHSGVNLWIGNNPQANGYPNFPSGLHADQAEMLKDSVILAEAAEGRPLLRSEVASYWSRLAHNFIRSEPTAWAHLLGRKVRNFWNAFEYDDVNVISKLREESVLLPGPHFGLMAALALPGLFLTITRFPAARWIAAAIILHMCAVLPVFVTERYRLAAAPGVILFSAAGLWTLWESCVQREYQRVGFYVALAALATWWVSTPPSQPSLWAFELYHAGTRALARNDLDGARSKLDRAALYAPDSTEIDFALGNVDLAAKQMDAAGQHYRKVLAADPHHQGALNNLGLVALDVQDFPLAVECFEQAVRATPENATAHYLLARGLVGIGNTEAAKRHLARALELNPNQPVFLEMQNDLAKQFP